MPNVSPKQALLTIGEMLTGEFLTGAELTATGLAITSSAGRFELSGHNTEDSSVTFSGQLKRQGMAMEASFRTLEISGDRADDFTAMLRLRDEVDRTVLLLTMYSETEDDSAVARSAGSGPPPRPWSPPPSL